MFDLRRPPRNHTYHDTFVNQTLETVLSARVPQAMVILPGPQVLPLAPLPPLPSRGHNDHLPQGPIPTHIPPSVVGPLCPCLRPWNPQALPSFTPIFPEPQVLWLPDEDRANVQQRAPRMRQIYGQQGSNRTERPQFLNLPYQDLPLLDIK